jgi:hypothetical protein
MPEIWEANDSEDLEIAERGEGGSFALRYHVRDCPDSGTASSLARALAPLAVAAGAETLIRQRVHTTRRGHRFYGVEVTYGPESDPQSQEPPQAGTWKFSFDTTGGRHTITTARMISRHWGPDFGEAPNLQGAINWDAESKTCKGVEIPVPALKFTITAYYEPTAVTPSFMREVARKTARTNTDTWLGFEPGEVLYFGGQAQGDIPTIAGQRVAPIAVAHQFEASENQTLEVEGFDSGKKADGTEQNEIKKRGWDYFWIWFKRRVEEDFSKVVGRPAYGYVHRPLPEMNFTDFFGFGGGG